MGLKRFLMVTLTYYKSKEVMQEYSFKAGIYSA